MSPVPFEQNGELIFVVSGSDVPGKGWVFGFVALICGLAAIKVSAWFVFLGLVIVAILEFAIRMSGETIRLSTSEIVVVRGTGVLQRSRRILFAHVRSAQVEVFTFANWDPHVLVATRDREFRLAWGVCEEVAHSIASEIERRIPRDV